MPIPLLAGKKSEVKRKLQLNAPEMRPQEKAIIDYD
jgi:hypothetical protein